MGLFWDVVFWPIFRVVGVFVFSGFSSSCFDDYAFCFGGILYLIFQDIAPMSKLRRRWIPALGAVLGFAGGILGKMIIEP